MSKLIKPIICFCLVLLFVNASVAKEWRGIVPLKSMRSDVERLFGKPLYSFGPSAPLAVYDVDEGRVNIMYSGKSCASGWDVPSDTVIDVTLHLKNDVPIADLKVNLNKYKQNRDDSGATYYVDEEEGIVYVVRAGLLITIMYTPTKKDERFRCDKKAQGE